MCVLCRVDDIDQDDDDHMMVVKEDDNNSHIDHDDMNRVTKS
jgi:hypothetical protein